MTVEFCYSSANSNAIKWKNKWKITTVQAEQTVNNASQLCFTGEKIDLRIFMYSLNRKC